MIPASLELGMLLFSCAGAALWTAYKFVRWECISTANISDQIGMAFWVVAVSMLFSRIGTAFST
jgi:hypothetical protein